MTDNTNTQITVTVVVDMPVEEVWGFWNEPKHIVKWNAASDDWHTTSSENNLEVGSYFTARMEAKDGSMGFDFKGIYDEIEKFKVIRYHMEDGRKVQVRFVAKENVTEVIETFDPEEINPVEMQRQGWQAILDNFKKYVENQKS